MLSVPLSIIRYQLFWELEIKVRIMRELPSLPSISFTVLYILRYLRAPYVLTLVLSCHAASVRSRIYCCTEIKSNQYSSLPNTHFILHFPLDFKQFFASINSTFPYLTISIKIPHISRQLNSLDPQSLHQTSESPGKRKENIHNRHYSCLVTW